MAVWRWKVWKVDRTRDHFELRYGDVGASGGWEDWLPVALVGPPNGKVFSVQLLVNEAEGHHKEVIGVVRKELDFYLVDIGEPDPWRYAIYHCGTMANVYSKIHWSFLKKENDNLRPRYPEPKERELSDDEKEQLRRRLKEQDADIYTLAKEFHCSSSQVAGIKAAMRRCAGVCLRSLLSVRRLG